MHFIKNLACKIIKKKNIDSIFQMSIYIILDSTIISI